MNYIDPAIVPRSVREAVVLAAIVDRGLSVHKLTGDALRITGAGVSIIAASLAAVQPSDLTPVWESPGRCVAL